MTVMLVVCDDEDQKATITVRGSFDHSVGPKFKQILEVLGDVNDCCVDLRSATSMDSSALGMLLVLRERMDHVSIRSDAGYVLRVLQMANFTRIFPVESGSTGGPWYPPVPKAL